MSYDKMATQLHTIEEIASALQNAHMNGYAEAEKNWWKQQDEEEEESRKAKKQQINDREPILVDDKKSSTKVNAKVETKK